MKGKNEDNSTDEIEVTAEMIEAGARELMKFNPDYEGYRDGALTIFEAMIAAKLAARSSKEH
jgi:hypothetical protein